MTAMKKNAKKTKKKWPKRSIEERYLDFLNEKVNCQTKKPPPFVRKRPSCLENVDIEDLRRRAVSFALKRGYRHEAEDFAQEFLFARFKGRSSAMKHIFVDYLRNTYGRCDRFATPDELAKSTALNTMCSLDENRY